MYLQAELAKSPVRRCGAAKIKLIKNILTIVPSQVLSFDHV